MTWISFSLAQEERAVVIYWQWHIYLCVIQWEVHTSLLCRFHSVLHGIGNLIQGLQLIKFSGDTPITFVSKMCK